jgi:hypothetical protein
MNPTRFALAPCFFTIARKVWFDHVALCPPKNMPSGNLYWPRETAAWKARIPFMATQAWSAASAMARPGPSRRTVQEDHEFRSNEGSLATAWRSPENCVGLSEAESRSALDKRALSVGRHIFGGHFPLLIALLRDARVMREVLIHSGPAYPTCHPAPQCANKLLIIIAESHLALDRFMRHPANAGLNLFSDAVPDYARQPRNQSDQLKLDLSKR